MSTHVAAVERASLAGRRRFQGALAGAPLLSLAMVASGVLTYLFHVLAARSLGVQGYGQIAILWGAIFVAAIILFRPLEQTASRAVADRLARDLEIRSVLRSVTLIALAAFGLVGAVFTLGWHQINERVFLGDSWMTAMLVAGIAAYGFSYLVRGLFGGARWYGGYAIALVADSVGRLLVAAPLVFIASQSTAATALVAAGLAGAIFPVVFGRRLIRRMLANRSGQTFHAGSAAAFAAPASIIAAADQLLTNGAPLLVIAGNGSDGTKAAGLVMAATLLVRAPVYVFQGLAAAMLPNFTHLQATEDAALFRRAVLRIAGFLSLAGGAIVAFAAIAGPKAMALYGPGFDAGRLELTLLGAGVAFYLAASTFSQALLAIDLGVRAAAGWTVAAVGFIACYAFAPGSELARISVAFALAMLVGLLLLAGGLVWRRRTA
jgi:O-antigen/teichoic acid export membrane protein